MKVLTLTQPWATLVAIGAKRIETRSFLTSYRGPLAIHAAKSVPGAVLRLMHEEPFRSVLCAAGYEAPIYLPLGKIIAVVEVVDCKGTSGMVRAPWPGTRMIRANQMPWVKALSDQERAFGDYSPDRYGWLLENVRLLPEPIPAKGMLGLWNFKSADLEAFVR